MRLLILTTLAFLSACATKPLPPPPTVEEIVQWSKERVPAEEIVRRIRDAEAVYRLSGSQLADLKLRGVPDPVIDAMYESRIAAERYEEYLQTRHQYMFWGWPGYGPRGPGLWYGW